MVKINYIAHWRFVNNNLKREFYWNATSMEVNELNENGDAIKDCTTCKNNVEYPPPHTCDICTSLDQEEEYEMWEER